MPLFLRRSILIQLLSLYLLFGLVILSGGLVIEGIIEQRLNTDVQASDQALAQEIALQTSLQLSGEKKALVSLGQLVSQAPTPAAMLELFKAFEAARTDVDQIYWLDSVGGLRLAWPLGRVVLGAQFSPPGIVEKSLSATEPVMEVGIATETTVRNAGVILAQPVRSSSGNLSGIVAVSFSLLELSVPLKTVVQAQNQLGRHLLISIIDESGKLVATPDPPRILQTVLDELPGAEAALRGQIASRLSVGFDGHKWLFSAVPVPAVSWAVIVQRPTDEALAVVSEFRWWLLSAILLFAVVGLLFWLLLVARVIRPLRTLSSKHQTLSAPDQLQSVAEAHLPTRADEVGELARSLIRLEQDGLKKLAELQMLLETSNAVVKSLEPHTVVKKIIDEVRKLVDVQAASVLLPDEQGILRVLVSVGHSETYDSALSLAPDNLFATPVLALRDAQPVQKLLEPGRSSLSYDEGYRSVLAVPIISRHVGAVVLLVHRAVPQLFNQNEIDLLLTFANYATLAWEHAVLYERSDERLREVARENARLYQDASQEKQRLEAIMGSMQDGLVLTGTDGTVLYANGATTAVTGLAHLKLQGHSIKLLYAALQTIASDEASREQVTRLVESQAATDLIVETNLEHQYRAIQLRLFDVTNETGQVFGRGLVLRDVTREYELAEFKTTLLAAVGHELRTPLSAIKGYASTLLQEDVSWPLADQRHFLNTISAEADRLAMLVSNLLDLSRQEAGLLLLNPTPCSVRSLLSKVLEQVKPLSAVEISLQIPADLPPVNIDQIRIEVVIQNLIANALVYGEGQVAIKVARHAQTVVIAITNNGPGISQPELPHIFERFYRAGYGRRQRAGGTGLGLAICKAFIEAHHSAIWAESSESSTTISFSLPLYQPALIETAELSQTLF